MQLDRGVSYCLRIMLCVCSSWGFPAGSDGKESACNVGDLGSIPGSRRSPGEGNGNPLQILAWEIPWTEEPGRQSTGSESYTTERLHFLHYVARISFWCFTLFLKKVDLHFSFTLFQPQFLFQGYNVYKNVLRGAFLFSWKSLFSWTCLKNHLSLLLSVFTVVKPTDRQSELTNTLLCAYFFHFAVLSFWMIFSYSIFSSSPIRS